MKSFGVLVAAAAALSLSLVGPAVGSSSHHNNLAAHKRRFDRVHRAADSPEQTSHQVIDVDVNAGGLVVRNATPVVGASSPAEEDGEQTHHLSKRGYNGRATFFEPGLGACGTYSGAGDFMVALNQAQYGDLGAVSSWCFQTITISYGGKTAQAQILDACPGCPYGGLDMSPGLFNYFSNPDAGVIYVEWSAGGGGGGGGGDNGAAAAAAASSSSAAAAWASSSAAAAAASSSSAAAAWLSSSRAAAWASSSSAAAAAAWASSSSSKAAADAAWASSSSSRAAAAWASSSSAAAAAAQASQASVASVAEVASELASASSASAAAAAASISSLASATASSVSVIASSSTLDSLVASATGSSVSGSASPSASAPTTASTQAAIPAAAVGGNLDAVPQLVIAIGNLVGAAAQAAK